MVGSVIVFIAVQMLLIIILSKQLDAETRQQTEMETTTMEQQIETETTKAIPQVKEKVGLIVCAIQPPKPQYYIEWLGKEISKEEFEMLCRLTFCEAGNQDLETQTMVCLTVLNRLSNPNTYADSIYGVIYQRLDGVPMYSVIEWSNFETCGWTDQVEQAVRNAMACNNHPSDMYYFRTEHYHTFGQPYMVSGALWFSTQH